MSSFPKLSYACPISWATMRGDERERYCTQCARTVVNVSLLTEPQRAALLANPPPGGLCVAYYRRLSGEFVSAESPLTPTESRSIVQYGVTALSLTAAAVAMNYVPEAPAALDRAQQAVTSSYVAARDEAVQRGTEAVDRLAVRLGLKPEPPAVLLMGMMICPPPPAAVPAPSSASPAPASSSP